MGRVKNREFWESATMNNRTFMKYYDRLLELSISMFEWKNVPASIDTRYLELALFGDGKAVFFKDEVLGYLALRTVVGGRLNQYMIPTERQAFTTGDYVNFDLNNTNSVIIWNNMLHKNSVSDVEEFSRRLYNCDRTIDVNVNAQKTPVLILCDETQRLTMKNLYMQYDGNQPFIFGDKSLDPTNVRCINTGAPYIADKIYSLKTQIWNEALTYLGISNTNIVKKERLITDEVARNMGGVIASRYSRLESRRQACREINRMFGLNLWCDYREDYQTIDPNANDTVEGEPNTDGQGGDIDG